MNSDQILLTFLRQLIRDKFPHAIQDDLSLIEEITCGNVLNPGSGATSHRAACLASGFPHTTPFNAINRQCSSGLTAVNDVANKILVGQIDCGLALGVESMSVNYGIEALGSISDSVKSDPRASKCLVPMGITNENIVAQYGVSRRDQDAFAAESHQKAGRAIEQGLFKDEIVPVCLPRGESEEETSCWFSRDEGPRHGVTAESLSRLKPAFLKTGKGTTTAGNSSQISDGAAAVLMMRRSLAHKLNVPILAKYIAFQTVGVAPEIMGVGPAYAIPKVLSRCHLHLEEISLFEINEAFAAQCLYCIDKLQVPRAKVNVKGGAIALGHPLGCTGARQVATLLHSLQPQQLGVVSMCVGTGMGAAAVFLRE